MKQIIWLCTSLFSSSGLDSHLCKPRMWIILDVLFKKNFGMFIIIGSSTFCTTHLLFMYSGSFYEFFYQTSCNWKPPQLVGIVMLYNGLLVSKVMVAFICMRYPLLIFILEPVPNYLKSLPDIPYLLYPQAVTEDSEWSHCMITTLVACI